MDQIRALLSRFTPWTCFQSKRSKAPPQQQPSAKPLSTSSTDNDPVTLIIAHGAFQTQFHYQLYIDALLQQTEIDRVLCPQQSSSGPAPPENCFQNDIEMLHTTVRDEILAGRDVLLVCHSYGGIPGCEALANLPKTSPNGGKVGRVLGIMFVSAFVADEGQSLITSKMAGRAAWVRIEGPLSHAASPGPTLFSLLSPSASAPFISALVPQASASFTSPTSHSTWRSHPCYYIRCTQDRAMVPAEQDYFIKRLKEGNRRALVRDLEADHAPFASMPLELARVTEGILGEGR